MKRISSKVLGTKSKQYDVFKSALFFGGLIFYSIIIHINHSQIEKYDYCSTKDNFVAVTLILREYGEKNEGNKQYS